MWTSTPVAKDKPEEERDPFCSCKLGISLNNERPKPDKVNLEWRASDFQMARKYPVIDTYLVLFEL